MEYARKFKFIRFYLQLRFDCDFNRCYLISRTFIIHQASFHNIYHQRRIFYLLFTYYYYYFNYLLPIKNAGSIWKRNKIVIACERVRWVVFLNAKKKKKEIFEALPKLLAHNPLSFCQKRNMFVHRPSNEFQGSRTRFWRFCSSFCQLVPSAQFRRNFLHFTRKEKYAFRVLVNCAL